MKLNEQEIISVLETVFKQPKGSIVPETLLEDFAKDSMDIVEFIAVIKNNYGVAVDPAEIVKLKTVADMTSYLLSHQSGS